MKKQYEIPVLLLIVLDPADLLTASGDPQGDLNDRFCIDIFR